MSDITSHPHTEEFAIDVINIALTIYQEMCRDDEPVNSDKIILQLEYITPKVKALIMAVINDTERVKEQSDKPK